jgi:hypothetical protein
MFINYGEGQRAPDVIASKLQRVITKFDDQAGFPDGKSARTIANTFLIATKLEKGKDGYYLLYRIRLESTHKFTQQGSKQVWQTTNFVLSPKQHDYNGVMSEIRAFDLGASSAFTGNNNASVSVHPHGAKEWVSAYSPLSDLLASKKTAGKKILERLTGIMLTQKMEPVVPRAGHLARKLRPALCDAPSI